MTEPIQFEKSIAELQEIVQQLERGDIMLEDALKQFEKGISLARTCQEILGKAEQKVEMLSATQNPPSNETPHDE